MIYLGDCKEVLRSFDDASLDAGVTSPPYYNLRAYSSWGSYSDYLVDMSLVMDQCFRVLKPGRHFAWNVQPHLPAKSADGSRWHYPLSSDIIRLAYNSGFMLESTIIWHKTNGCAQRMFGSYPYPPSIIYTCDTEDIHIFRKPGKAVYIKNDESRLTLEEWKDWTTHIWHMPVDYVKRGHTATFPLELPYRFIKLHSLAGDTILDPFTGSGTTGVACKRTNRNFVGIELNEEYHQLATRRLEE